MLAQGLIEESAPQGFSPREPLHEIHKIACHSTTKIKQNMFVAACVEAVRPGFLPCCAHSVAGRPRRCTSRIAASGKGALHLGGRQLHSSVAATREAWRLGEARFVCVASGMLEAYTAPTRSSLSPLLVQHTHRLAALP